MLSSGGDQRPRIISRLTFGVNRLQDVILYFIHWERGNWRVTVLNPAVPADCPRVRRSPLQRAQECDQIVPLPCTQPDGESPVVEFHHVSQTCGRSIVK